MIDTSLYNEKVLQARIYPKINAYYFKQWQAYEMAFHQHPDIEIMYVIEGKCMVELKNEAVSLKKGDFIFLDSEVSHRLIVGDECPCRMLNVEFTLVEKLINFPSIRDLAAGEHSLHQFLSQAKPYMVLKDTKEMYHTLKNLVFECDKHDQKYDLMIQLLLSQLLIQISRMAKENQQLKSEHQQANMYVNQAIEFLHQHYDVELKLEDVGKAVNLHPGYLHRIFRKLMGCTIMEYLTDLRIEKAKGLLVNTEIPIIDISHYIGLNSSQYFSQLFKKHVNMTPVDYRRTFSKHIEKYRG